MDISVGLVVRLISNSGGGGGGVRLRWKPVSSTFVRVQARKFHGCKGWYEARKFLCL